MSRKTAISLFSGAGGLDVGFEKAGFQILFANEFDHDAACTWRQNRPLNSVATSEGDITEKLSELNQFQGKVDVLFGGPPVRAFLLLVRWTLMTQEAN